jgi:uncharacterized DUF497 family protein
MQFEWDENKNKINIEKHKLPMVEGTVVFNDPLRKEFLDYRNDYGEERMVTIGLGTNNVLYVCWTERSYDRIRLISVRKATKNEQGIYNGDD